MVRLPARSNHMQKIRTFVGHAARKDNAAAFGTERWFSRVKSASTGSSAPHRALRHFNFTNCLRNRRAQIRYQPNGLGFECTAERQTCHFYSPFSLITILFRD